MSQKTKAKLFDVLGVSLFTSKVRVMATGKTENNAQAFADMAVIRRGVEREFFAVAPSGMYRDGDTWHGPEEAGAAT